MGSGLGQFGVARVDVHIFLPLLQVLLAVQVGVFGQALLEEGAFVGEVVPHLLQAFEACGGGGE